MPKGAFRKITNVAASSEVPTVAGVVGVGAPPDPIENSEILPGVQIVGSGQ